MLLLYTMCNIKTAFRKKETTNNEAVFISFAVENDKSWGGAMSGTILSKDIKILCTKSGNRCALPDCRQILVVEGNKNDPASLVAQMAHIKGEKPGKENKSSSARYDETMTEIERNSYENLILVCPSCHKKIDDQPNTYTVELLHRTKKEHEEWIINSTKIEVINVSFAELDIVTKHLIANQDNRSDSLTLIPPKDKITKNGLSNSIEQMVLMGMTQVKQVASFVENITAIDSDFTNRLINGFVSEYERLRNKEGVRRNDLFESLMEFSCGGSSDFKQKAAGLSVLVYLFEKCEVFEK